MIECRAVTKIYKGKEIVKELNLCVEEGAFVVIEGESGGGKSTLLNMLALLVQPTSGEILIEGENIALLSDYHSSQYRKNFVGYLSQEYYLFENLSVYENLLAPLVVQDLSFGEINKRIEQKLQLAHIANKRDAKVAHLSGGEKQRVVLAKALLNNPKLLLCDEPTANLDDINTQHFIALVEQLQKEGSTLIVVTHDKRLKHLESVSRYYKMHNGTLQPRS